MAPSRSRSLPASGSTSSHRFNLRNRQPPHPLDEEILRNLQTVQLRNSLPPSTSLDSGDFSVEMETGTGKTYVYLRTIFEQHRCYGFTKFVIVVPLTAIKEGVYK